MNRIQEKTFCQKLLMRRRSSGKINCFVYRDQDLYCNVIIMGEQVADLLQCVVQALKITVLVAKSSSAVSQMEEQLKADLKQI